MARFLIEVEHEPEVLACVRVVEVFLRTGSHFLTHADWGCKDGVHKAWIIAELDSKSVALNMVPADFRSQATVVQLNTFSLEQIDELRRHHGAAE
jgi:hypothetical protein